MRAYQWIRNVSFSENFAYVRNGRSLMVMLLLIINSKILVLLNQPQKVMFECFTMEEEGKFKFRKRTQRQENGFTNRKQYSEKNWSRKVTKDKRGELLWRKY